MEFAQSSGHDWLLLKLYISGTWSRAIGVERAGAVIFTRGILSFSVSSIINIVLKAFMIFSSAALSY